MPAIEIKNLTYIYSKKTPYEKKALDSVNLEIEEGSFVGIVGATGSGKSTLIQHLNGLIKIQDKKKAQIIVNGMSCADKKTLRKLRFEVGMVFQYPEYQLFADTVAKDVAFGPKNMKLEKEEIDERVKKAMDVVGLDYATFADRSPFDLSGGEKRRAAIAGVIAMQPKILILDEPVAGLDPVGREEILALVKKLQKEVSPTVIMVSHNMDDIAVIADRIVALKDGKIVADGTPKEVFSNRRLISDIGLDVPCASHLADEFIARGIPVAKDVISMDELCRELARIKTEKEKKSGENSFENLDEDVDGILDQLEVMDEDLAEVENEVFEDGCECGCDCDCENDCHCGCHDDDEECYEVVCPTCGEKICISEDILDEEEMSCPNCGELLEFDLSDCDCDCCCGCECDCDDDCDCECDDDCDCGCKSCEDDK